MKALILAGGKSSRLRPLTSTTPKQLLFVDDKTVIDHVINHLRSNRIHDIIICTTPALKIQFSNVLGSSVEYSTTPVDYDTSGRIFGARRFLHSDDFVVYYGDILASFPLRDMLSFHKKTKATCTVAVCEKKELAMGFVKSACKNGLVRMFVEHPSVEVISNFAVNVGIAICKSRILSYCRPYANFFGGTIPFALKSEPIYSFSIPSFMDIGTFNGLEEARKAFREREMGLD